jgi:peptidoglycan/xylan/chitin deacetylase (PgdA/CDA1 family)
MTVLYVCISIGAFLGGAYWLLLSSRSQLFGKYPFKGDTREKVIALTFDDGPNEPYTSEIVDYLNNKNVKATFFQVGKCIKRYPQTVKKMVDSGHIIGNHSLSHEFHKYFLNLRFDSEIMANQAILQEYAGKRPALYRSPWLWRQPWLLKTLKENSLQPVSGTFCYAFEVFRPSAARIAKHALAKATPGSIIIFHDGVDGRGGDRQQTVDAVKITVDELLGRGYTFVTVDQLLNVPAYQPWLVQAPKKAAT